MVDCLLVSVYVDSALQACHLEPFNLLYASFLQASPRLRFNREGSLLAVTTSDNGIKILANADGQRLVRVLESRAFEGTRVTSQQINANVKVFVLPTDFRRDCWLLVEVVGTWTARYRAVPSKIDRRRSIEREKGRKKKKRKKKKKKEKRRKRIPIACARSSPVRCRRSCVVASRASSPPTGRQRPRAVAARGSRALFLPRGEKDRGDVASARPVSNVSSPIAATPELTDRTLPVVSMSSLVVRLLYTNSGLAVLALGSNAIHKLWKWTRNERNPSGKVMTAIQKKQLHVLLCQRTTLMSCLHPVERGRNYVLEISVYCLSILILITFHSCLQVKTKLKGHQKKITGLAFSQSLTVLVSSGADAQVCILKFCRYFSIVIQTCSSRELCSGPVYPLVIAAHPSEPNQIALGMSDGAVHVVEPSDADSKWGAAPPQENGSLPRITSNPASSNNVDDGTPILPLLTPLRPILQESETKPYNERGGREKRIEELFIGDGQKLGFRKQNYFYIFTLGRIWK
ncbi:hypothetical protein GW17_00034725 [Ensete ventricosum]|nr:hypothetical protein GW17_00034725 [Ensete ventricosum]